MRDRDGVSAVDLAAEMDAALESAGVAIPILHHGFGDGTWRVIEAGLRRGRDVRIGLEDTLTLPDGTQARDNAQLVTAVADLARRLGREPLRVP